MSSMSSSAVSNSISFMLLSVSDGCDFWDGVLGVLADEFCVPAEEFRVLLESRKYIKTNNKQPN